MSENLKNLSIKFSQMRDELMKEAQELLYEEFSKVFDAHPDITVITWTQYRPYFNDGDECNFGVNDFYISNALDTENVHSYGEYEGDADNVFVKGSWDDKSKKYSDVWDLERFANTSLGLDVFETAFGDGSQVRATRNGITSDEYDHD